MSPMIDEACATAEEMAADVERVIDHLARALAAAPEAGCATVAELDALAVAVSWITVDGPAVDPRPRLRWLITSGLERACRTYLEATSVPAQGGAAWSFDPRDGHTPANRWAASTVAALLTIRANGGPEALDTSLRTIVDYAGSDDLWSLLTETARTWGHLLNAATTTGRVPAT